MLTKKALAKSTEKPVKKNNANEKTKSNSNSNVANAVQVLLQSPLNSKSNQAKPANPAKSNDKTNKKAQKNTQVIVNYDAGFSNELYIRGEGANLNWKKGQKLKNISANQWSWECNESFSKCEFKILINDKNYETGENHCLKEGDSFNCSPKF